jgi:hypothetical protein
VSTLFVKPDLPGSVVRFVGETLIRPAPSAADVVAVPIIHDWGPLGADEGARLVSSFAEFEAVYGAGDTAGRDAVLGAFQGVGVGTQAGAGGVLVYRMATGAAAKATIVIQNTTPAAALTLTAKHEGDAGEDISYVVEDDPQNAARDRLRILFRGATVEKYTYTPTDITALAASINARSQYVDASGVTSGTALTPTAGTSLAGGDNGSVLTVTEWQAALDALEFERFGLFAPFNLTDGAIKAVIFSWQQAQADGMRPVMVVFGGASGETVDQAITDAAIYNDEHVVRFGVGTYHDDLLDKDLSTAQLAPRIAGVLAARGETMALTRAELGGLTLVSGGPTSDELVAAAGGGVTCLRRTASPTTDLVVSKGVTTFTDENVDAKPLEVFSEPRMVRVMDNFIRSVVEWGDDIAIGDLTVTEDARALVRGKIRGLGEDLERRGLIDPGTLEVSVEPPDDPTLSDAIPFEFGWRFTRTVNYIIGNGRVR